MPKNDGCNPVFDAMLLAAISFERKERKNRRLSQLLLVRKSQGRTLNYYHIQLPASEAARTMGDQKALRQGEHLNTKFMKIKDHLNMQQASKIEI